jgi:hypothetical protein
MLPNLMLLRQPNMPARDIKAYQRHVRFTPESGHELALAGCPLCAKSGQMHRSKQHHYSIIGGE